ncbi:large ribosomal subunit protein mL43 [Bacillus rossius redtenbacheri]|uniref:large ribosomal subunit protein mL43 n=1 Tax=Bacillus rossius redtenbacheri TaxID=93214 RepID=UPI002FDCC8B7
MSNSHLFLQAGFLREPLTNGIGRVIVQLQRITFKFCKYNGASNGVREFLESDLLDFANGNPGIVVYVKPRRHHSPNITAEYLNGERQVISLHNFTRDEVNKWVKFLRTQSGNPFIRFRKMSQTVNPSIQGTWTPFTNRNPDLNVVEFPQEMLSHPVNLPRTATEHLQEIFRRQQGV